MLDSTKLSCQSDRQVMSHNFLNTAYLNCSKNLDTLLFPKKTVYSDPFNIAVACSQTLYFLFDDLRARVGHKTDCGGFSREL